MSATVGSSKLGAFARSATLLSPLQLDETLLLKSRVFMAPMTRGRTPNRVPDDNTVLYYEQRAGAGLIIAEGTTISPQGLGWVGSPGLWNDEHVGAWHRVTDAVHAAKGHIFCQLWHTGRAGHSSYLPGGMLPLSASPIAISGSRYAHAADGSHQPHEVPHAMTEEEIKRTVQEYKDSAALAKRAGFDGIELHGANGYLIDQFLQSSSNKRTDRRGGYGGSVEKRFQFLKEVVEAVLQVWPPSRVAVRLSPNGLYNGMGSPDNVEQFLFACSQLAPFSLGYLHVLDRESPGNFDFHKLCKPVTLREVREVYGGGGGALVGNVGYGFDSGDEAVRSGYADAVAFGRPYISSPDLAERFANGWPLAPPAPVECYYATKDGPKGYVDFPPYDPAAGAGGGRGSRKEQKQPLPAGVVAEEQRSVKREAETVGGVFSPS